MNTDYSSVVVYHVTWVMRNRLFLVDQCARKSRNKCIIGKTRTSELPHALPLNVCPEPSPLDIWERDLVNPPFGRM